MKEIKDIKEVQQISLGILKFVDKVCKEHNIQYFLGYGTALGAVRHGGFIPWDDDIDLLMTRDNYNKFLDIMKTIDEKRYKCLSHPNIYYSFAKVVDGTTYVSPDNYPEIKDLGVSIDIFPLDNLNEKTQKKDVKKVHVYNTLGMLAANTRFEKSNHGPLVTLVKYGVQLFAKIFGWKFWINKAIKRSIKYNNKQCRLVSLYDSTLERCNFEKEIFDKVVNIKFEDAEFPIMAEFDKYLTISYGDYMTPPPKEEQVSPHKFNAYYK